MTFLDVRTSKVKAEEQFKYEVCIYSEGGRDEEERGGMKKREEGKKEEIKEKRLGSIHKLS